MSRHPLKALLPLLGVAALLGACSEPDIVEFSCAPMGDKEPICGFSHPEDLELLPDDKTLIVSEFGRLDTAQPGALVLFDTRTRKRQRLPAVNRDSDRRWLDVDCPGPPGEAFSPHGIHLSQRDGGDLQLLVVNHGGGERIDAFEVSATANWWRLDWRGCAVPPDNSFMNDVVATPGGGFVFTHMYDKDTLHIGSLNLDILKSMLGLNTGYAMHWDGSDYRVLEGSRAAFPNGIQIDSAGRYLFVNALMNDQVYKVDLSTGERVGTAAAPRGDNIQWDADGRLLVASQNASIPAMMRCLGNADSTCGARFDIVRVDPDSLASEIVFSHEGGPPMGGATVAQQVGQRLYLGSFAGDRLLAVPYKR